jgi:formate C-acetyltransferase
MNLRLETLKTRIRSKAQHVFRQRVPVSILSECETRDLPWIQRAALLTVRQCEAECVVIEPDERIVFTRTLPAAIPAIYGPQNWAILTAGRTLHELGPISNICADWGQTLRQGLLGRRRVAIETRQRCEGNPQAIEFLDCAISTIDAVLGLAARYATEAERLGRHDLVDVLKQVPAHPPRSFHEALQSLRLLHAVVWLSGHYHVGLGRFDQYMWPYLRADLEVGRLDEAAALELLEEFFITLNKDSDLSPGVQQGDNGQSMTLGGLDAQGQTSVNPLTALCLRASGELCLIDPKINLRVTSETSLELLEQATELTRKGLGFPQYSNDTVVIPGLVAHGYAQEDARDYAVAACWEFLVPGRGMEVVNAGAVSFPAAVDQALRAGLPVGEDLAAILQRTAANIRQQVNAVAEPYQRLLLPPAPYYSVLMSDCLERGQDISFGARYNNLGIHGAGAANAADALAAVEKFVFQEQNLTPIELISALDNDFVEHETFRQKLAQEAPKVGNDDPTADRYLVALFDMLADACEAFGPTARGGVLRPGTGSAMYYIWLVAGHAGMREPVVGATAEGRHKGRPLGANLAPSQGAPIQGPFSTLLSFGKINYHRICNGGPVTIELSDSVFRPSDSIRKVALLVRAFTAAGCQQLQLNTLNVSQLREAQQHPELYRNLIVRVWGWSGYFCELGPEYQEQIIARHMFQVH